MPQGISAELIAARWGLSRTELDEFSAASHEKAAQATKDGLFDNELVPIAGLQYDEIGMMVANQLQSDWQTSLRPPCRHAGGRLAGRNRANSSGSFTTAPAKASTSFQGKGSATKLSSSLASKGPNSKVASSKQPFTPTERTFTMKTDSTTRTFTVMMHRTLVDELDAAVQQNRRIKKFDVPVGEALVAPAVMARAE